MQIADQEGLVGIIRIIGPPPHEITMNFKEQKIVRKAVEQRYTGTLADENVLTYSELT